MKKEEFIERIQEIIEDEEIEFNEEVNIVNLETFDSLAILSLITLIDECFGIVLTSDQLGKISTIKSIMEFIGYEKFK